MTPFCNKITRQFGFVSRHINDIIGTSLSILSGSISNSPKFSKWLELNFFKNKYIYEQKIIWNEMQQTYDSYSIRHSMKPFDLRTKIG